jgi:hypothetical protein
MTPRSFALLDAAMVMLPNDEGDWAVVVAVAAGGNEVNKLELREVEVQSEALGAGEDVDLHVVAQCLGCLLHAGADLKSRIIIDVPRRPGTRPRT